MILFIEIILLLGTYQGLTQEITFNDYTYTVHTTIPGRRQWAFAKTNCINLGGNLATIYSKQIDSLLFYMTSEHSCWIGLNDIATEAGNTASAFVWADGSNSTYRQFASIEPNGGNGGTDKDCVDFRAGNMRDSDGWDDRECDAYVKCYFCQKSGDSRGCDLIYEGSCYRAFEVRDGINWLDAQSSCAVWGGDLTSITTERENDLLYTAISDTVSNWWIGLYERDGDGMYQWVDGTVLNYTNWTGSAPTNGNTNDCVQMNTNGAGSWIATDCESTSNSFICNRPSTSTVTTVGRFGELINGGKNFEELNENTFYFNSSLTLVCGEEENSATIQWVYREYLNSSSQTLTPSYASTGTGLSWITINNSQQGYYSCVINSSPVYTIGLYDLSLTTVVVSGSTYTYIVLVDREDVLLLCDPMDSSAILSTIAWTVLGGMTFINPLNIFDERSNLPTQSTEIICHVGATLIKNSTIMVKAPKLTIRYGSIIGNTFSSVYPDMDSITVPISNRDITISINIDGKWNLPNNSNSSNSELTIPLFSSANAVLYKFYISNWDGEEKCAMQLNVVLTNPDITADNELIFGNSTYGYITTASIITWLTSQLNCNNWGGNLATIDSKQIDSLLFYLTSEHSCWIGLNDINNEAGNTASAFVWADGSNSTYRQFASNEPNGGNGGTDKDCVDFRFGNMRDSDGWDDRECDAYVKCYFCQKSGDSRGCDLIYEGSCYRAFEVSDGINWEDAQSSCAVWGGDLTSITTEREKNLLYTAISDTVSNCWIGLYERDGDGMYQWVDGTVVSYTNWVGSAPTNDNTNDCIRMNTNGAGSWIATDCEGTSNSFICKRPSTTIDVTGYSTMNSISLANDETIQNGSTIITTEDSTIINCIISNPEYNVEWFYRSLLGDVQTDVTHSSVFSARTGISTLNISSDKPGYYSCVISTDTVFSFYVADRDTLVQIQNFNSPTQQVDYTAGDTNSMLYYSHASIPDISLHWTTDTVTDRADTQYSIEYPNPVPLSRVFSEVGAGVHTFSCFYRMSPVTLVGSLILVIKDTATISISYERHSTTFSDVYNLMFPSPQHITIPDGTQDVNFTCNLTQCIWMIQVADGITRVISSFYMIPVFGSENVGNYSLIRETNRGHNYSTAQAYISFQTSPIIPIVAVIILIITVAVLIVVVVIIGKLITKKVSLDKTEIVLGTKKHRKQQSEVETLKKLRSTTIEYVNVHANPGIAEYMTIDETSLIPLETDAQVKVQIAPYYSDIAPLSPIVDMNESAKESKGCAELRPSQQHGEYYTTMSILKVENTFVSKYIPSKEFPVTYQQYVASGMGHDSLFSVEFKALNVESVKYIESSDEARKDQNIDKNPMKNILPYDENRVVLDSEHFECNYINASYMNDSQFIASIHPTENTLQDFLQMIYQTEASMVIMLSTRKEKAKIISGISNRVCYWPKKDEILKCGPFETNLISSNETTAFVKQKISLKHTLEGKSHPFIHCISPIWNEDGTVIDVNSVIILLTRVLKQKQDYPLNPIIIHCEDGISKTGVFLTVFNVIKELNIRKSINIFNAVKNLRKQRMSMVPTMTCYTTCYSLMNEYCSIHL